MAGRQRRRCSADLAVRRSVTAKIGIIICARYKDCGGGKCLRGMRERREAFSSYPVDEPLEIVGYATCSERRVHEKFPFRKDSGMAELAGPLFTEAPEVQAAYD